MTQSSTSALPVAPKPVRIRIFVDFWNLGITLNEREMLVSGNQFMLDWTKLPACFVKQAATLLGIKEFVYEGCAVYTSYNPKRVEDKKFHKWVTTWLDKQPGIQVECFERKPRSKTKCQKCHRPIEKCSYGDCGVPLAGTVEKGVDTAIAVGLIRLAWEGAYDVAILASSDADLVPAVEFLNVKGIKVIQAGFPPSGTDLATSCWGSFDLFACRNEFRRKAT